VNDAGDSWARFVAEARACWPALRGDDAEFVAFVRARIDDDAGVAELRLGDLWLAHRCAANDPAALRAFRDMIASELDTVLRDPIAGGIERAELEQRVLERLFADTPRRRARIHDYTGRGPIGRWVYVVATRIRFDMQRKGREQSLGEEALDDGDDDPELDYFKRHYREAFREAFQGALADLSARERTLLRLHVVHGRSATGIAEVYRVHRATAKRWLASIRERLLEGTRARLQQALSVDARELESIMRLIGSRLEASVRAHLGETVDAAPS
jgi:RNA polymerase sigma-70 factor (ECF subfamily)